MHIKIAERIERGIRAWGVDGGSLAGKEVRDENGAYNPEHQAFNDGEYMRGFYETIKDGHSFLWAMRMTKIAFICKVLGIDFDVNDMGADSGY